MELKILYDYQCAQLDIPMTINWNPEAACHFCVAGPSGTGKTIASAWIASRIAQIQNSRLWIADWKGDDIFKFLRGKENIRYWKYKDSLNGIESFYSILEDRLSGCEDRSFCLLWVDELANMILSAEKKESEKLKIMLSTILQMGRSMNFQIVVSLQRADSAFFSNGTRENFGNILLLGNQSKEAIAMMGFDKEKMQTVRSFGAGNLLINGSEQRSVQVPYITKIEELQKTILKLL